MLLFLHYYRWQIALWIYFCGSHTEFIFSLIAKKTINNERTKKRKKRGDHNCILRANTNYSDVRASPHTHRHTHVCRNDSEHVHWACYERPERVKPYNYVELRGPFSITDYFTLHAQRTPNTDTRTIWYTLNVSANELVDIRATITLIIHNNNLHVRRDGKRHTACTDVRHDVCGCLWLCVVPM